VKVVTWNCAGAFRKKFSKVAELDADVYIIQECENPAFVKMASDTYREFSSNHLWQGDNKNKGLGVFTRRGLNLRKVLLNHDWRGRQLQWFLPFTLTDSHETFKFLGLWNHGADAKTFDYIGQFWLFLQNNRDFFHNATIAGDFNSNTIWDSWDRWWNHTDCVNELSVLGLQSLYHLFRGEEQGKEITATFLLQKNSEKKYHIDYIFADKALSERTQDFKVHDFESWLELSDHVPIEWRFT
jgi:exonuclease III